MATTAIWSVKGSVTKILDYAENPEKTAFDTPIDEKNGLSDVIDYATRESKVIFEKTVLVSGVNCSLASAKVEMLAVKNHYRKNGGITAFHGYQSFAPGETTPEIAHEIGVKLAQKVWGDRFQVVVATHLNTESLHSHFVVNSVSFADGKRYNRSENDYRKFRAESDKLCREYALSVVKSPQNGKTKPYIEWQAEKAKKPTWRSLIKADLDLIIAESSTMTQFFGGLKKEGYEIKQGKFFAVRPPGKERFFKPERHFGEGYSVDGVKKKILAQSDPTFEISEMKSQKFRNSKLAEKYKKRKIKLKGRWEKNRKIKGIRALYYRYLYKMGVIPKKKRKSQTQVSPVFREDLRKLGQISQEIQLLCSCKISTSEQLFCFKNGASTELSALTQERTKLRNKIRRIKDENVKVKIQAKIGEISGKIAELRKEVKLCESVEVHTQKIASNLKKEAEFKRKNKKVERGKNHEFRQPS